MIFNFRTWATAVLLSQEAVQRVWCAFLPATLAAYPKIFKDLMGFLVAAGLSWLQVSTSVKNYLIAIRSMMVVYGPDTSCLRDQIIPLFIKALKINIHFHPHLPLTLDKNIFLIFALISFGFPA